VREVHDTASNRAVTKRGTRSPFFSGCTAYVKPTIRQDIPTAAPRPGSHLYDEGAGAAAAASGALGVEAPTGVGARPANRLTENNRARAEGRGRGGERDVRQRSQVPSPKHAQAQGLDKLTDDHWRGCTGAGGNLANPGSPMRHAVMLSLLPRSRHSSSSFSAATARFPPVLAPVLRT
jgi:hypothetical protein